MKEKEFLKKLKKLNLTYNKNLNESIEVPIYFSIDENNNVVLDTDGIREELENKLNDVWELTEEETDELTELVEEKINNDKVKV